MSLEITFNRIENKEQLLEWAKAVNNHVGGTNGRWLKLQDVLGMSQYETVKNLVIELKGEERRLVFFSIWKCNGDDYFINLVDEWMRRKFKDFEVTYFEQEIQPKINDVYRREDDLQTAQRKIWHRIFEERKVRIAFQEKAERFEKRLDESLAENKAQRERIRELERELAQFHSLKSLLTEIVK